MGGSTSDISSSDDSESREEILPCEVEGTFGPIGVFTRKKISDIGLLPGLVKNIVSSPHCPPSLSERVSHCFLAPIDFSGERGFLFSILLSILAGGEFDFLAGSMKEVPEDELLTEEVHDFSEGDCSIFPSILAAGELSFLPGRAEVPEDKLLAEEDSEDELLAVEVHDFLDVDCCIFPSILAGEFVFWTGRAEVPEDELLMEEVFDFLDGDCCIFPSILAAGELNFLAGRAEVPEEELFTEEVLDFLDGDCRIFPFLSPAGKFLASSSSCKGERNFFFGILPSTLAAGEFDFFAGSATEVPEDELLAEEVLDFSDGDCCIFPSILAAGELRFLAGRAEVPEDEVLTEDVLDFLDRDSRFLPSILAACELGFLAASSSCKGVLEDELLIEVVLDFLDGDCCMLPSILSAGNFPSVPSLNRRASRSERVSNFFLILADFSWDDLFKSVQGGLFFSLLSSILAAVEFAFSADGVLALP